MTQYVPDQPTIAADLMLLLFSPHNGTIAGEGTLYYPLGGAVLAELALDDHGEIEPGGALAAGKVTAVGPGPQDPLLREAWERIADKPKARRPELVSQMTSVLVHGVDPAPRTAVLGALLSASGQLHTLHRDIPWSGAVAKRGKVLEKGDWAAEGVSTAIQRAAAAVATSVVLTSAVVVNTSN